MPLRPYCAAPSPTPTPTPNPTLTLALPPQVAPLRAYGAAASVEGGGNAGTLTRAAPRPPGCVATLPLSLPLPLTRWALGILIFEMLTGELT